MFLHNFKYAVKTLLKNKTTLIWTLAFPIALSTFMYMSFGEIYEEEAMFEVIPVAVVEEQENPNLMGMLEELSKEGENQVLDVKVTSLKDAKKQLDEGTVTAIICIDEEIKMTVASKSYDNTVLKSLLEEYKKIETVATEVAVVNPELINQVVDNMTKEKSYFTEKSTSDGNQDVNTNYFYAVFSMSCLFSSFAASEKIRKIKANTSPLGMRRSLSPSSKAITVMGEFSAMLIFQFIIELITLAYLTFVGVDFGDRYPLIAVVLFFGTCIGISEGVIIGSISKLSENIVDGLCISISMTMSVLADLVASGVKDRIEHTLPIINKINPAALIVDSFYALNVYDTLDRYIENIAILGGMSLGLLIISFMLLRRNKYASL